MHRLDELINTLGLAYSTIFFFIRIPRGHAFQCHHRFLKRLSRKHVIVVFRESKTCKAEYRLEQRPAAPKTGDPRRRSG